MDHFTYFISLRSLSPRILFLASNHPVLLIPPIRLSPPTHVVDTLFPASFCAGAPCIICLCYWVCTYNGQFSHNSAKIAEETHIDDIKRWNSLGCYDKIKRSPCTCAHTQKNEEENIMYVCCMCKSLQQTEKRNNGKKHVISFLSYQFNEIFFSTKERDQLFHVLISVSCLFIFHFSVFFFWATHSALKNWAVCHLCCEWCITTTTAINFFYPLISFSSATCLSQMFPNSNISHTIMFCVRDGRQWRWCDITATLNDEKIQLYSLTYVNTQLCACVRSLSLYLLSQFPEDIF